MYRKNTFFSAVIVAVFAVLLSLGVLGAAQAADAVPDSIVVRYKDIVLPGDHGQIVNLLAADTAVVAVDMAGAASPAERQARLQQRLDQIRGDARVRYAEPNYGGRFEGLLAATPNDPEYAKQWWLPALGDRTMWAVGSGDGVTVAVIDSGVDMSHPDLTANLLAGYDWGDLDADPQDAIGHGTRVAGIIAAQQNNGIGVSGLAPKAKILPVKVSSGTNGTFSSDTLAQAIRYAVDMGVQIINLSLTVDQSTQVVADAIQYALDHGVAMVAAAGNTGGAVAFPANMAGVIAVAATDETGKLASYSCFGPEIAVAAPGSSVTTTLLGGSYGYGASGTSFSAPVVSAALADLRSLNPALPVSGYAGYLKANTTAIAGGSYSFGLLQAGRMGLAMIPALTPNKSVYNQADTVSVNYSLPPTGGAVDIYVTVQTPVGEFALHPDGQWSPVGSYVPVAAGYVGGAALAGQLFGPVGAFPGIALAGLPAGPYTWRVALIDRASGRLIGAVNSADMTLQ